MIIKVHKEKDNKFVRILISTIILISSFSYYAYHITLKTQDDNKAFDKKIKVIKHDKKVARKYQRYILNEFERILNLIDPLKIDKIKFVKDKLIIYTNSIETFEPLKMRYKDMIKTSRSSNIWKLELDLATFLEIKLKMRENERTK
jgi:hypothetical protein